MLMPAIDINQAVFAISDQATLRIPKLTLKAGQCWSFVGANGSGKTALARVLANELPLVEGEVSNSFTAIEWVAFEQLQALIDRERAADDSDFLDYEDQGSTAREIILEQGGELAPLTALAERFGITDLLDRGFRYLSTGETRKVLLCRA